MNSKALCVIRCKYRNLVARGISRYTYATDVEEQALEVGELVWGDLEQAGRVVGNTTRELLVGGEGIYLRSSEMVLQQVAACLPDAMRMRVVPVSVMPDVAGRTVVPAPPKVMLWSIPTNSLAGAVDVIGLSATDEATCLMREAK